MTAYIGDGDRTGEQMCDSVQSIKLTLENAERCLQLEFGFFTLVARLSASRFSVCVVAKKRKRKLMTPIGCLLVVASCQN